MALTITSFQTDPNVSAGTPNVSGQRQTYKAITLDNTAYATGGLTNITPSVLGFTNGVLYAICSIRTANASAVGEAVLDCTNPAAPKLKLNTSTAELANAATTQSGVVVDILATGW